MKSIVFAALMGFGFGLHAAELTYNPEYKALRKVAGVTKEGKADAQFEKCKIHAQKLARAAFGEMFASQNRTVVFTDWLAGGHPSFKGADKNDPEVDPSRYVMEVGVRSSTYKAKDKNDKIEYSAFMQLDKKCEMVDNAKFISSRSPEWEKFDMDDL